VAKPYASGAFHVEEGNIGIYLREISRYRPLTNQEECEAARRIRSGDRAALEQIVKANLRFVVSGARNYLNQGMSLPDLINEGNIGLVKAARRFDETKNFRFISYAVWWVRQSILQSLANQSRFLRVPLNRVATIQRARKARARLEQRFRRVPNADELAREMGTSTADVVHTLRIGSVHASLDAPAQSAGIGGTLLDTIAVYEPDSEQSELSDQGRDESVAFLLKYLTRRERRVVALYYGLSEGTTHTLEEIAVQFGLTRERVRQIKEAAIEKLRLAHPGFVAESRPPF